MTDAPLCSCHGEPMKRNRSSDGGWNCRVKKRERDRVALLTDKGRARRRRFRLSEATRSREAQIKRIEKELSSPSTTRSPKPIWPGTRSVAPSSTA